jgi:hypothetical protein
MHPPKLFVPCIKLEESISKEYSLSATKAPFINYENVTLASAIVLSKALIIPPASVASL